MNRPYRTASAIRSPLNWVRRRARRLERFYQVSRSEAVANAWQDWTAFQPTSGARAAVH